MSRTKYDILKDNYEGVFSGQPYDTSVNKNMNQLYVFPAMDEYAKQEAIGFAKFLAEHYKIGDFGYYYMEGNNKIYQSINQYYKLYLQSKQQP